MASLLLNWGRVMELSQTLKDFVASQEWTFAKTYASTWPHEYIVRDRVDEGLFLALVRHIRKSGYEAKFYKMTITYFDEGDLVYWTMGEPLNVTTIINRCRKEQTYESRSSAGTLPEDGHSS
ncbi:MAG: hypothetical protein ABIV21_02485 [Pyrinomonadaceae bacterium]